ncbi:dynein heavy chain domain-containing protein 1 isoform X2 [Acanthochromis polyacanthus]|uniref:dynein heavy chain domain-containing protein 1 isoform X2 n=1 Tax=Acanthochromis polyacanthus TaxID=80966 RepID=UPI0022342511|nr:dynein heavy chain domain-containing protein 1 isoform X2 [Acanthochromis polyacanthus]
MFAAPAKEKFQDGSSQNEGKDIPKPGSKVKKKAHSPEVTLPPLCPDPSCLSSASAAKHLFSHSSLLKSIPSDRPLTVVELPPLTAPVGPGKGDTKWTKGQSLTDKDETVKVTTCKDKKRMTVKDGKATRPNKFPLTGTDVVQIFAQKRDPGDLQLIYLKEADGNAYRPYDLRVVHSSDAGSEHYIFSRNTVIHVTETGYGGLVSLTEWYREYVLWTAMQEIPLFRNFRLRKAFSCWHRNVRKTSFQRKCKNLEEMLLIAVPHFRNALHLFTGVIEELKGTHWMPLNDSKTYTLLEFKDVLITNIQECLQVLQRLSQCHTFILNAVKEESCKTHQELQVHIKFAQRPNKCSEPIHLHLARQQELKKELARSKGILQKLGNFAALIHRMIVQSVVTIIQRDAISFLNVLKRRKFQHSPFHTELCFGANSQLTLNPPIHLFQETVSEALLSVNSSIVQMCDNCGFFLEITNSGFTSDSSWIQHSATTEELNSDWMTGRLKEKSVLRPKESFQMVQGNMVHGCYYPLSKTQLEWQISTNDITKHVEKVQVKTMQEAELEIQELCASYAWLKDICLFVSEWSQASLESMSGQPALSYKELIRKLRNWTDRINTVDSSLSTTNQLFIVDCTSTKETLGRQLRSIEEEVLQQLVEQIKLHSESVVSDLERATAELKTEPQDLHDFSKFALTVRESAKVLADIQKRIEYIHSLHTTMCMNYRKLTVQELSLEEKMLRLWNCFNSLFKQADGLVCHRLSSAAKELDTMFSFLVSDLKNIVSDATSGPFLDSNQNAKEMASKLNSICADLHSLSAKLEQLNTNSQNLQEHTMDLTILTTDVQKVTARKELWELKAVYTTWLEEWKQLLFSEVAVQQDQGKIAVWKEQAQSLTNLIPIHDAVLQETLEVLESLNHQLELLAKLQSPTLKDKHWRAIFQDMGLLYVPEKKVTVADLMSWKFESHGKLINKICRDAQTECNMEQTFQKLRKGWEDRLFQLDIFTLPAWQHCRPQNGLPEKEEPTEGIVSSLQTASQHSCNDSRLTVIGLEILLFETENDLMTLSTILKSPHSTDFRLQLEDWTESLQKLRNLLELFERYQQMWAFLTKVFGDTSFGDQRVDLLKCFLPADETFKEVMVSISVDHHVLHFDNTSNRFHGDSLCQILSDGLSTMETISNQMSDFLEAIRGQYLRLWFLSDMEVMKLLSFHPTPFTLQPFVRRCFKEVCRLEVDCEIPSKTRDVKSCGALSTSESHRQMTVLGIFGSLNEHIAFQSPLEPNLDALVWLNVFEKQFKLTMMQLMKQCALVRNQLEPSSQDLPCDKNVEDIRLQCADRTKKNQPVLDLISKYPLQCLLVVEEAAWCHAVQQSFQQSNPVKLSSIKANSSAKLRHLGQSIRDAVTRCESGSLVSRYTMMCRRALVQLTMNHAQQLSRLMELPCALESSFEWLSLMKYHVNSEDQKGTDDPACYVDVLGHHFQYGFEYNGPEEWMMVHTPSTDQARLGTLLALASYKCGFVSGSSMSGKKMVVGQLGKTLGRQVVVVQCYPSMRPGVIQQILLGALQTGAWLLLDSVDLLTQDVLSFLGQQLVDIQQSFSELRRKKSQRLNEEPEDKTDDRVPGCTNIVNPECHMVLEGKSISASLNYGCVAISSNGRASKIPESLRFATRPVALMHPDYRIIAEVMLTSFGFSEAMSLSQRLVSLLSLAKDFHCLPDLFTDESCFLGVLQKIICASELHLQQNVKQRAISNRANAVEHTDLTTSQKMPVQLSEKDRKDTEKLSELHSSHLSVVWSLLEETAIVKAVLSVLIPVHMKASQFYILFRDAFPIASHFHLFQHYIEEAEKNQLQDAITEELQQKQFHCDANITCSAVTLYQTLQFSKAVMLIGPSGSGKTTCHSVLAEALNSLAAKAEKYVSEKGRVIKGDTPQADAHISASNWSSVNTLVLFPNAMSHEEIFGWFCEKTGWQDGAAAKVLRDVERRERTSSEICNKKNESDETPAMKWLIMDGEPVGKPGWLDYLTTLCNSQDPFLCLSSGETLLSQSHLKLLMEITDLQHASPSAVTRCSLVYFTGTDLWKSVWKSELGALSFKHKLSKGVVRMWNSLAEDLFSSTLSLLGQQSFNSAIHTERESRKSSTCGLQEIMSFARILHALLQHFGKEVEKSDAILQIDKKAKPLTGSDTPGTDPQSKQDQLTRSLFLVAYIWGFGGHLHSCHWPHFDLLVRQVLFTCRYKIVVPEDKSVFDHFFSINRRMCPKNTLLAKSIIPKHEKYTYLLNLMLEANQPVLLAGEPDSGKTTLCKILLTFDKPHISLPASPLLSSRDLRPILNSIRCQKNCKDAMGSRLLLFVDDLHEAPCDVFGETSMALETLRQSISKGEILIFDTCQFKLLSSTTISYMATCCVSGLGCSHSSVISSRFSRLFSIFVLPSLSLEVILSIHSPSLKTWLKELPLKHCGDDMSYCIITATKHLYHAVCDQFQSTLQRPHFIFSHHDLEKVFQGMCLWQSDISNTGAIQRMENSQSGSPPILSRHLASVLNIVQLWMHECMRTFSDRLCTEDERKTLVSLIAKTAATHYENKLSDEVHPGSLDGSAADTSHVMDTASMCQPIHPDILHLESELKEASALPEPFSLSENICAEEASLQSHPLEPQILQHMEDKMTRLMYGPELSEALRSLNLQQKISCSFSYQTQELDVLLQKLSAHMDRKEEDEAHKTDEGRDITTRYMVHRQRVCQLLHILRALLVPGGHGLLIASDRGTGRKTTVRLAAYLTGYQLIEVHSGNENNLHEILKQAGNQTREDGIKVIILAHEEISQPVREELLLAMAHRAYPPLYTEDELRNQVSRVTTMNASRKYVMGSWMFEKTLSQAHRNVHVFLLMPFTVAHYSEMPPNNETQRWIAQMSKALRLSCCVEVYQPWSSQTLVEVASQCLKTSPHKTQEGSEVSLPVAMAGMHQSACQYASVLLTAQPFTPRTYMGFIAQFGYLFSHLHKECQSKTKRLSTVLSHLDVLNNTAIQYKQILLRLQNTVSETQQHEKELLKAVDDQKSWLKEAWEKCVAEENKLSHLQEQIKHAEEQEKPAFLSYLRILKCLNPSDLEEVRHYRDPPDRVVKILDAVCLLFNRPPGWESAKQLLGQSNFLQELEFFDRYDLTNEQLQRLGQIVHSPQFGPESVCEISKACESLCQWVQAVYDYCCVQKQLLVRQPLEVLAKEVEGQQRLSVQLREEAYKCLEHAKHQQQFVHNHLEELLQELHKAETTEREVAASAGQLEIFVRDWRAAAQEAELRNQNAQGDALILAAVISYLGPLGPDIRTELLSKWRELCQTGSININPKDPRTSLFTDFDTAPHNHHFGFPIPVTERLQLPLGQALGMKEWQLEDTLSARLVVKLLLWGHRGPYVQRWPLLTDTQQHLEIRCQNGHITGEDGDLQKETEFEMVLCADDPVLLDKLDQAAEKGLKVLVTHMERAVPTPQFLDKLVCLDECCFPGQMQPPQLVHPDFCLFLSTHLPVRQLVSEIHASILARVRVVDLSLSTEEIQELMLTQLLQSECEELLIQTSRFQNSNQLLRETLITEKDALMDYIMQSDTVLLLDPGFSPLMAVCLDEMEKLQAEMKQLSEEQEHYESLLAVPLQLVRLAAALYEALQTVSHLSPAYFFSLRGFIKVMQEVFTVKERPLVSYTIGKVPGSIIPEIMNMMVVQLLVQYRPCLSKSHAAVLKLLVSLALLQHNQLCSEAEKLAFLRGLKDIEHPETKVKPSSHMGPQSSNPLPSWISPHVHSELLCLEKAPSYRGLIASLCASPLQWQEYLHVPSSTVTGTVPCRSHSHLSLLQRALLWKTMLPNFLEGIADDINACQLCLSGKPAGTEDPHTGNPEALSRYIIKHEGPIILVLPNPEDEKWISIHPLHLLHQMARCVSEDKEVQVKVVSFGGQCDRELILSMLDKAINDGHWVVFNNCHVLEQWDDEIMACFGHLISPVKEEQCLIHPSFRLWFITQENASHLIPATVRMCALNLVCDSPWDLKEELRCSLQQVVSINQPPSQLDLTADNMELLLRCAIFHSVLLQRQTYKYLGYGQIYHWSQEDLLALVDAYICTASRCHDKTKVLQDIAVNLVHGSHVMDSADLEVVESVAATCFCTALPFLDNGPHIISNIVTTSGLFDFSRLPQVLKQELWDSTNMKYPVLLGFSVDVAAELIKINSHNLNKLLQASHTPLGTERNFNTKLNQLAALPAYSHAGDRLQTLKSYLTHKNGSTATNAGTVSHSPLRDFLQTEWDDLIDSVSLLLSQLQQPVQYTPTFAFLLKLTDLSHLERRAELLGAYLWHHNTSDPPGAYRLSAFRKARGFLVAVMREAAKVNRKCISDISLHFQVLCDSTDPPSLRLDAAYLCGLELKGASWDTQLGALQETLSPQPCSLPLLHVTAQVKSTDTVQDTLSCEDSAGVPPKTTPQLPVYQCPLYHDREPDSENWELADVNIITKVPLHTKLNPVLCSVRRVRLVSTL